MKEIQEDIEMIVKNMNPISNIKEIYIFGSYAYGTPNKDSDIDICIITHEGIDTRRDVIKNIRKQLLDAIDKPVDILVYTDNQFQERAENKSSLEYTIISKGVKVYG